MKVAELMQTNLKTVAANDTVTEAMITMADSHVLGLPVIDDKDHLVGVVSTTDLLTAMAEAEDAEARAQLLDQTTVRELMTARPITVSPDADVLEAAKEMLYMDIHRIFVEYEGRLVGVLSQTDIVGAVAAAKI
jgi:CBS domain-containing protein